MTNYETKLFENENEEKEQSSDDMTDAEKNVRDMLIPFRQATNSFAMSPTVGKVGNREILFIGSSDYHVYAIDIRTGEIIWKYRTGGAMSHNGALHNGVYYVGSHDTYFYALRADTGELIWRFKTGDIVQCEPLMLKDRIIFGSFDKNIYALSYDGQEIWHIHLNGLTSNQLLYVNDKVFFGAGDGRVYALTTSGRVIWSTFIGATFAGSPSYIGETNCISFCTQDGHEVTATVDGRILHKINLGEASQIRYHCATANGITYVGIGEPNSGSVNAIDTRNGKLLWRFQTGGRVQGTVLYNDIIICPSLDKNIYVLDKSGKLVWKFQADAAVIAPMTIYNDFIFTATSGGHVYCIDKNGILVWRIFFPGQAADIEQVFAPMKRLTDRIRSIFRWWRPEKAPSKAYETQAQPQVTFGPSAYRAEIGYKSGSDTYKMGGPAGYEMNKKKKDWRDPFAR